MSYSFRERLAMAMERIKRKMKLTQEEVDYIIQNLKEYCWMSDELLIATYHIKGEQVDEYAKKISDEEFDEVAKAIIRKMLADKKKAKKKQKKEQKETDSDTESDTDGETEEAEAQEQEVECAK